jgi:hypothetical protein
LAITAPAGAAAGIVTPTLLGTAVLGKDTRFAPPAPLKIIAAP